MSNEFNPVVAQHYDNYATAAAGFVSATVMDFGASLWNSTAGMLGADEVSTYDLLRKYDRNALAIYEDNRASVETASFIGGIFIPAGLAMKGMGLARAGVKGAGWFSNAGRLASRAQLDDLYKQGKQGSAEFAKLRRQYYANGAANQVLDTVAMEVAILGTMNAHPFMEDYMDDPIKGAAISLAIGGALGVGLGHIVDRGVVRGIMGKAQQEAHQLVTGALKTGHSGLPSVANLQLSASNIKTLEAMVAMQGSNQLVRELATDMLLVERNAQRTLFDDLAGKLVHGLPEDQQQLMIRRLAEDVNFQGVDKIEFFKATAEKAPVWKAVPTQLPTDTTMASFVKPDGKLQSRVYHPEFGVVTTSSEALQFARASALEETEASIRKVGKALAKNLKDSEASLLLSSEVAAKVDRLYLQRLAAVDSLKPQQLANAVLDPSDLPTIQAMLARASKAPSEFEGVKIKLTKNEPNYDRVSQAVFKSGGVKPDHHQKMLEFTNPKAISQYDMFKAQISSGARDLLHSWRNGNGVAQMRTAADAFFRGGYGGKSPMRAMIGELYNSQASVALREQFRKIADPEGNVYLWRGMQRDPRGHAALESYTTDIVKAREFGQPRLFKVHVDDILGAIADLKSSDGIARNEIIVGSPARQMEARLPVMNSAGQVQTATNAMATGVEELTIAELSQHAMRLKEDLITSMAKLGTRAEVISIRTNTPLDTVRAFLGNDGMKPLSELANDGLAAMSYTNAGNIAEYLNPLNRAMVLKANRSKVPYAELSAKMDVRALEAADRDIKELFFASSKSKTVQGLGKLFFSEERRPLLDMMRQQLSHAVEGLAGWKFIQSSDFYVRHMKEFGKIASIMGKDIMHHGNEAVVKLLTPVNSAMASVNRAGPEALIEANTALALNSSLKGHRIYKDRQFWQEVEVPGLDGKMTKQLQPATFQGQEFRVVSDSVDTMLRELATAGREMLAIKNTANKILGTRDVHDLGFWAPAFNPRNKHIAYVWDHSDGTTKILFGNTAEELDSAVGAYKAANADKIGRGVVEVVEKGKQDYYNRVAGRAEIDPYMEIANVEKLHKGASTPAVVKANVDVFTDITTAYEHYMQANIRQLADMAMSDITGTLAKISERNQFALQNQPLSKVQKWITGKEDPAAIMRNTMLGVSNVHQAPAWQAANGAFETGMGVLLSKAQEVWRGALEILPKGMQQKIAAGEEATLHGLNYEQLAQRMEAAGIHNPYAVFDEHAAKMFGVAKLVESKNVSKRLVNASNALTATVVLRFGEIAQPLVNAMSLPILSIGLLAERLPPTFMGVTKGTASVSPVQAMMEGVKASVSGNTQYVRWSKAWEEAGYFKPLVSEASDVLKLSREFEPGAIAATERALESNLVKWMSWTADNSEAMVRRVAMFTGGNLAKRMYPELSDAGVTIFARDFMDKVIGNYHAAQRPTAFQGTLGTAASLFQTYMLTMAQRMYGQIESGQFKALAKMMLTQQTVFGMGSLPGFRPVSELIGEHFSDDNVDLTTGTMRALPKPLSDLLLYGLPSASTGAAFYTRGELAPRAPTTLGEIPAFSIGKQAFEGVMKVAGAVGSDVEEVPMAMAQALSMQSISRPLARWSEIATGHAVTRQGNTIAIPEEVWSVTGVMSRMMTTRPLEEAKLRDAIHMDRFYGSLDREQRMAATADLKTALRYNTLTAEKLESIAEKYMRTGSPQGWRAAVNEAIATSDMTGREAFARKLQMDNPLMHMIDGLDGAM